ncbi:MAG: DUF4430 domain-containing protein [Anaerovoracaceae bacterium]|jgi:hypothetical protein
MKKILVLMLTLALVIGGLAGCGSGDPAGGTGNNAIRNQQEKTPRQVAKEKKKIAGERKKLSSQASGSKTKESVSGGSADGSSNEASSSEGTKKKGDSQTGKKSGTQPGSSEKKRGVTISISAERILYSKRASDDVKSLVPGGGYLMSERSVGIKNGDTVKSVLLRTAKSAGIVLSWEGGDYLVGIGGIFEFDGGPGSGWMYSVNGKFPNAACSQYKVKKGDVIAWKYTNNRGSDL